MKEAPLYTAESVLSSYTGAERRSTQRRMNADRRYQIRFEPGKMERRTTGEQRQNGNQSTEINH